MARKLRIAIVGPGRLGSTLALRLKAAGYRISEVVSRSTSGSQKKARALARSLGARAVTHATASLDADLIWFCVADREIATAARELEPLTNWKGKTAFHSSGALASDELNGLRTQGAKVASVHPLMTFVGGSKPSLKGVSFAVEGDTAAVRLARRVIADLGGEAFVIAKKNKSAYHAWGAFTSPLLVALLVASEQVAKAAGISAAQTRRRMLPIVNQTLANYASLGPAGAFSGPLVRGDADIVRKHLRVLQRVPGARDVYVALAEIALHNLPVNERKDLDRALRDRGLNDTNLRRASRTARRPLKIGDKVRVAKVPPGLQEGEMGTRTLFDLCLDHIFPIVGFQGEWVELEVGRAVGKKPYMETIWIEPQFVELVQTE
jgi:predicted short-subunit dehydrogenase-like oxidoreductase (DUF2520 family)